MDEIRRDILLSIRQFQQSIDDQKNQKESQALQGQPQPHSKHLKQEFRPQEVAKQGTVQLGTNLSSALLYLREECHRLYSEQNVLNDLYFETLATRYGRISAAHHRTFDWLLEEN